MINEFKKLRTDLHNSICLTKKQRDKKALLIHAVDCAIEEEERLDAMIREYEERFKWA